MSWSVRVEQASVPSRPPWAFTVGAGDAATELPDVETLPQDGQWVSVAGYVGMPTIPTGYANHCPWLSSRSMWSTAITTNASRLARLLQRHNVYPHCDICMSGWNSESHLPAADHFDALQLKIAHGVQIVDVATSMWQQWDVPGGAVRFNHIHGRIELWRGVPPEIVVPVTATSPAPAAAAPAQIGGLCFWLWRHNNEHSAAEVDAELTRVGIRAEQFECSVCRRLMVGGAKHHLLSAQHVEALCVVSERFVAGASEPPDLSQSWDVTGPARITLRHLPLSIRVDTLSGVQVAVVASRPVDCVICQEPYGTGILARLRCGHTYHLVCIDMWMAMQTQGHRDALCPYCRQDLVVLSHFSGVELRAADLAASSGDAPVQTEQPSHSLERRSELWDLNVLQDGSRCWRSPSRRCMFIEGEVGSEWQQFRHDSCGNFFWSAYTHRWFLATGQDMGTWDS